MSSNTEFSLKSIAGLRKEMNISHSEPAPEEEGAENNEDEDEEEDEEEELWHIGTLALIKFFLKSNININKNGKEQVRHCILI